MKILCVVYGSDENVFPELNELRRAGFDITPLRQDKLSREDLLTKTKKFSETHDILIVNYRSLYPPKFIKSLKNIYTVFYCADDPYGSEKVSKPFVRAFNHSFSGAVMYDKKKTMIEMYKKWGAERADFRPLGLADSSDPKINKKDIFKSRKIDLVHIGNPQNKTRRLLEIYRAFPKMKIFGRSFGIKGLLRTYYHILTRKKGWYEEINPLDPILIKMFLFTKKISEEEKIFLRKNAKICLNMHQSSGPVNMRLFEIPASGALQICDCPEGLGKIFRINKEVVGYGTEKEAIEKINYYLKHEDERKAIALNGWKRCMKDYKRINCWKSSLKKIKKGMLDSGITHFKDGSVINVN